MPRRVALLAALACAPFGLADDAEAESRSRPGRFRSPPVTVTSPLATATLRAGETVVLAWEPLPELRRHGGLEEWEAFLSLDDGDHYPVRLTPHLDLDRRSFAITLPQFAATRARLLLRFGDEEEELEYELPGEFEIHRSREHELAPAHLARGRGEPARPGNPRDPGVAIWVEGTREGREARTVFAARDGAAIDSVETPGWILLRAATASPEPPNADAARPSSHPFSSLFAADPAAPGEPPRAAAIEPRRTTCRQNE